LEILVHTGSGVYIRSLARDLGKKLNTGAYLSALKRTKVGEFEIADALTLEKFEKQWRQNQKS
jgi:tRNA pseudouridine55 synthase